MLTADDLREEFARVLGPDGLPLVSELQEKLNYNGTMPALERNVNNFAEHIEADYVAHTKFFAIKPRRNKSASVFE